MTQRETHVDCLVIGAGPGGLGTAALLQNTGKRVVVLERASRIADTWRRGYDRLRINTSSWFSYLPDQRFPKRYGRWVSRHDLVEYYEDYARRRELDIRTGIEARRIVRAGQGWEVETSDATIRAGVVVIATGKQSVPLVPSWPGRKEFSGELLHAADYRDAEAYGAKRAMVVGLGNSGMDIALDLAGSAQNPVWLAIRRAPHIMPREVLGLPHDLVGVLARRLPRAVVDANAKVIRRLAIGDLSAYGLPIPDDGTVERFETEGRVPTIDSGEFTAAVRAGAIQVVPDVRRLDGGEVVLADGRRLQPDVVVATTGYRPDLERLVGHLGVLGDRGLPVAHGAATASGAPGLFFVGFLDPRSGALRELRLQAEQVARAVRDLPPMPVASAEAESNQEVKLC